MKIAKRLVNGWTPYITNKQKYNCDDCGDQLHVAPDGKSLFCNRVHGLIPVNEISTLTNGIKVKYQNSTVVYFS